MMDHPGFQIAFVCFVFIAGGMVGECSGAARGRCEQAGHVYHHNKCFTAEVPK